MAGQRANPAVRFLIALLVVLAVALIGFFVGYLIGTRLAGVALPLTLPLSLGIVEAPRGATAAADTNGGPHDRGRPRPS